MRQLAQGFRCQLMHFYFFCDFVLPTFVSNEVTYLQEGVTQESWAVPSSGGRPTDTSSQMLAQAVSSIPNEYVDQDKKHGLDLNFFQSNKPQPTKPTQKKQPHGSEGSNMISVSTDNTSGPEGISNSLTSVSANNKKKVITKQGINRRVLSYSSDSNTSNVHTEKAYVGEGENKYEILLLLGEGTFGKVYKARRARRNGQVFAVKEFIWKHDSEKEQSLKEARILSCMEHDHIIKQIDIFLYEGSFFLVMEFAEDGDLSQHITKQNEQHSKTWKKSFILFWFAQIVSGVQYLHDYKIIHRDIKPQNILVTADRALKIADFGFARTMFERGQMASTVCGTDIYMAPEVLNGERYSFESDVWSLGCVLFELCMLQWAFDNVKDIIDGPIPRIADISSNGDDLRDVSATCFKMLNRFPGSRPSGERLCKIFQVPVHGGNPKDSEEIGGSQGWSCWKDWMCCRSGSSGGLDGQKPEDALSYEYMSLDDKALDEVTISDAEVKAKRNKIILVLGGILVLVAVGFLVNFLVSIINEESNPSPGPSEVEVVCNGDLIIDDSFNTTVDVCECHRVEGSVMIHYGAEQAFILEDYCSNLYHISGDLDIVQAGTGFVSYVEVILGTLKVQDTSDLMHLTAPALSSVGDAFLINNNNQLVEVNVPQLVTTGSDFSLLNNARLPRIELPSLNTVGSNLRIDNNDLLAIVDFPNLERSNRDVRILGNDGLVDLCFPKLHTIGEVFFVTSNTALSEISFPELSIVNAFLDVTNNDVMATMSLPKLHTVGELFIFLNNQLKNFSFPELTTIGTDPDTTGNLLLWQNTNLVRAHFPKLETLGRDLEITNNTAMVSVAFPELDGSIDENLQIYGNFELVDIHFPKIDEIGADFNLYDNFLLKTMYFNELRGVGSDLLIRNNDVLEFIDLSELRVVGLDILINNNDALQNHTFPALKTVGGDFIWRDFDQVALQDHIFPALNIVGGNFILENGLIISLPVLNTVEGYIQFGNSRLREISAPSLRKVGGCFQLTNYRPLAQSYELQQVSLPLLETVGNGDQAFQVSGSMVEVLRLPALKNITGPFYVENNDFLREISFPVLECFGNGCSPVQANEVMEMRGTGGCHLMNNPMLETIDLPHLQSMGFLTFGACCDIRDNELLHAINLPALKEAGTLWVRNNAALQVLNLGFESIVSFRIQTTNTMDSNDFKDAPSTSNVGQKIFVDNNPSLEHISLPTLNTVSQLYILDHETVRSVSFPALETVGELSVRRNIVLQDLNLPALKAVSSSFQVIENLVLHVLNVGLERIGFLTISTSGCMTMDTYGFKDAPSISNVGEFCLSGNPVLEHISLPTIKSVTRLWVRGDQIVQSVIFPALETVGELSVSGNSVLQEVSFPVLETVEGDLLVSGNRDLPQIDAPSLESVGNSLQMNANKLLQHIELRALQFVGGNGNSIGFILGGNANLLSVSVPVLQTVDRLVVDSNHILQDISMPSLENICKSMQIGNNNLLQIVNLPVVESIAEYVLVENNMALKDLSLTVLSTVGGSFKLSESPALQSFSAPMLISVGSWFDLSMTDNLQELSLPALQDLGGQFYVLRNEALGEISMPALQEVDGCFYVDFNGVLQQIDAPGLERIGEYLLIRNNNVLQRIQIPQLNTINGVYDFSGRAVEIRNNGQVPQCVVSDCFVAGESCSCNPCFEDLMTDPLGACQID